MKTFTDAEKNEIRAAYRQAKSPGAQVGILADLYACKKEDICRVLELPLPSPQKAKRKSYDQAVREQAVKAVLLDGDTQQAAAERFGVPRTNVASWVQKAKAKQQEFMSYPEATKTPVSAKAPTPPPDSDILERTARELRHGADGLQAFADNFAGVDIFTADEWCMIDLLCERAKSFSDGFDTAMALVKEAAK